jgi:thymidine phosphorylase
LLDAGAAEAKFLAICAAQGGFHEPGEALQRIAMTAGVSGYLTAIDNRLIARIAKLAGAPRQQRAGVRLMAHVGEWVEKGQPLYEIHAETTGELAYARAYAEAHVGALKLSEDKP